MRSMWKYLLVMLGILMLVGIVVLVWKIFFESDDASCEVFESDIR